MINQLQIILPSAHTPKMDRKIKMLTPVPNYSGAQFYVSHQHDAVLAPNHPFVPRGPASHTLVFTPPPRYFMRSSCADWPHPTARCSHGRTLGCCQPPHSRREGESQRNGRGEPLSSVRECRHAHYVCTYFTSCRMAVPPYSMLP